MRPTPMSYKSAPPVRSGDARAQSVGNEVRARVLPDFLLLLLLHLHIKCSVKAVKEEIFRKIMGSLLCCLRGAAVDEEDGDSNDNEQVQESNNTTNRSTTQAGFTLFAQDFTKMYNSLFGRGVTEPMQASSSTRDGKGLNREPELVCDGDSASSKDDECLICLEEYTDENPRIITKCSHHCHLSCILEWQQRSELCPVCAKLMEFEEMS